MKKLIIVFFIFITYGGFGQKLEIQLNLGFTKMKYNGSVPNSVSNILVPIN